MNNTSTILSRPCRTNRDGLTIIELLTVIGIIVLAAMVANISAGGIGREKCRNAARLLVSDLAYAQMYSFGNGLDPCVVVFNVPESSYFLATKADHANAIEDPVSNADFFTSYGTGRAVSLGGVTIESIDATDGIIEFDALGSLGQVGEAAIVLRHGTHTERVTIDGVMGTARID